MDLLSSHVADFVLLCETGGLYFHFPSASVSKGQNILMLRKLAQVENCKWVALDGIDPKVGIDIQDFLGL